MEEPAKSKKKSTKKNAGGRETFDRNVGVHLTNGPDSLGGDNPQFQFCQGGFWRKPIGNMEKHGLVLQIRPNLVGFQLRANFFYWNYLDFSDQIST